MKICKVLGCENKHHAKGYCNKHYFQYVLKPSLKDTVCRVDGCEKEISPRFTKERLCEMHGTRLRRNGGTELRQRERDIKSLIEEIINSESPLDYEIPNLNSFSEICRLYYGDYCHECGWNKGSCEAHHIKKRSDGGKSTIRNGIVLCPNCHSLKHKSNTKRYSQKYKKELVEKLRKIK